MTWEILFVLLLLVGALVSFALEKISTDQTAFFVFALLILAQVITGTDALPTVPALFAVFSNPAPITVGAMFILSAALEKCGAIERLSEFLRAARKLKYPAFIFLLVLFVGFLSAFINNTPVVVVLLPVILSLARDMGIPASRMLIPLSYASIMGGTCTLLGTSTNILASGIMEQNGLAPLGMFEIGKVGLPILFLGTLYLMVFGKRLIPHRETLTQILSPEERREYITEAFVNSASPLIGKTLLEGGLQRTRGVRVLEIIRQGVALSGQLKEKVLQEGDRLVLSCRPHGMVEARNLAGIDFVGESGLGLETIAAQEGAIVEGVIGPKSTIVGRTIREINFRQRYRMIIVAIHREGRNVREKLETLRLQLGDTLLLMGSDRAIENLRNSDDILLLDKPRVPSRNFSRKMPLVICAILGIVLLNTFRVVPIEASVFLGLALLFATGSISLKEAYASVDWSILMLIFGMLALGSAMQSSGTNSLFANFLQNLTDNPILLLAALFLLTSLLTETLSNNATVVLMTPIALEIGLRLGFDPRPFLVAVCIASSASFSTPIGYQTNTYVYGVGGYRFTDFIRVGIGLNLLYFFASICLIPLIWSF